MGLTHREKKRNVPMYPPVLSPITIRALSTSVRMEARSQSAAHYQSRERHVRPQGGRERHETSHLVNGGVWPTHRCEWIPGVVVRNGGGLDGGGRKNADGATEPDDFAESSGFHIMVSECIKTHNATVMILTLRLASRAASESEQITASRSIIFR